MGLSLTASCTEGTGDGMGGGAAWGPPASSPPSESGREEAGDRGSQFPLHEPDAMVFHYLLTCGWPAPPLDLKLQEGGTWPACFAVHVEPACPRARQVFLGWLSESTG